MVTATSWTATFRTGATVANYDVTPEGRFLMLRREAGVGDLRVVLNWTEELKRLLAEASDR